MTTSEGVAMSVGDRDDGDAALVRATADGSRAALAELFRRHKDGVYGVAYRVTGSIQDAEDVLQDVFLGLERALRRYQERGRFAGWIREVAARVALMKMRSRGRRTWERLPDDLPSGGPPPDLAIERLPVHDALAAMPEGLRTVFLLKEVDGYSHGEIAALLDIRPGASRVRLHRAWAFLEGRLGEDGS